MVNFTHFCQLNSNQFYKFLSDIRAEYHIEFDSLNFYCNFFKKIQAKMKFFSKWDVASTIIIEHWMDVEISFFIDFIFFFMNST